MQSQSATQQAINSLNSNNVVPINGIHFVMVDDVDQSDIISINNLLKAVGEYVARGNKNVVICDSDQKFQIKVDDGRLTELIIGADEHDYDLNLLFQNLKEANYNTIISENPNDDWKREDEEKRLLKIDTVVLDFEQVGEFLEDETNLNNPHIKNIIYDYDSFTEWDEDTEEGVELEAADIEKIATVRPDIKISITMSCEQPEELVEKWNKLIPNMKITNVFLEL